MTHGYVANRKRVQRLMRLAGLVAIYPAAEHEQAGAGTQDLPLLARRGLIDGKGCYMDNIFVERLWAAPNTRRRMSTPMPASQEPRPASAPGSASITRSANTRAWATARCARPTKPVDMCTIGFADRLRLAPTPTGTTANHRIEVDEEEVRSDAMTVAPARSEPLRNLPGLYLKRRLRLPHDRGSTSCVR